MNLKTILFKLGLRKVRYKDVVTVKEPDDKFQRHFLVIGKQFNIKKDKYNKQESKGRVAVESRLGCMYTHEKNYDDFKINKSVSEGTWFKLVRTKDIISVR